MALRQVISHLVDGPMAGVSANEAIRGATRCAEGNPVVLGAVMPYIAKSHFPNFVATHTIDLYSREM